jgi:flavorubredoxin
MPNPVLSDAVRTLGVFDPALDLFESQYPVPQGVTYNSYVILDEKIAVLDAADARAADTWMEHLTAALAGRTPDYLVISHMEPDHSAGIARLAAAYPEMRLVGNARTFTILRQFFSDLGPERFCEVKEGGELALGAHTLRFYLAPMVHWPEVMVSYETTEKLLFSADAFGTFGPGGMLAGADSAAWAPEARRYYCNIVGKYGVQVQALLKKLAGLEIRAVCPLHGPVLAGDLAPFLSWYDTWSSYRPEAPEEVLLACASIHGHTKAAAARLAEVLRARGAAVTELDLTRTDVAYAVAEAFRCGRLVLACATYDGGLFPPMEAFLAHLKSRGWQNRRVALMENGSWAPMAARQMRAQLEDMKDVSVCAAQVTVRSALHPGDEAALAALAEELLR